jgi:antitoxin component of MazEF toxin-antitoxin module
MKQKIIQVGDSTAVIVPKKLLTEQGLKVGDEAEIELRPAFKASQEIHELTQSIISKYRPALKELAKR